MVFMDEWMDGWVYGWMDVWSKAVLRIAYINQKPLSFEMHFPLMSIPC